MQSFKKRKQDGTMLWQQRLKDKQAGCALPAVEGAISKSLHSTSAREKHALAGAATHPAATLQADAEAASPVVAGRSMRPAKQSAAQCSSTPGGKRSRVHDSMHKGQQLAVNVIRNLMPPTAQQPGATSKKPRKDKHGPTIVVRSLSPWQVVTLWSTKLVRPSAVTILLERMQLRINPQPSTLSQFSAEVNFWMCVCMFPRYARHPCCALVTKQQRMLQVGDAEALKRQALATYGAVAGA
jgi:hypothetical protein